MILVTGSTGTVGRQVVAQLVAAGEKVRAMTRNPAKANFDGQVEVIQGDFGVPETLKGAVQGVDAVFSLTFGPQTANHEKSLAQAAKAARVRRIVKLSALGGDDTTRNTIRQWHDDGEREIRETGIPLTVLRPTAFMSNALHWRESIRAGGKVFSNYGDGKLPPVHPRDIAAVAVLALTSDAHKEKIFSLTGPEALTIGEQVRLLSDAIGKPLEYVPVTDDATRKQMERAGMPGFLIDALIPFAGFVRSGKASRVLPTVEEVTGGRPLTFKDWARENASAFQ